MNPTDVTNTVLLAAMGDGQYDNKGHRILSIVRNGDLISVTRLARDMNDIAITKSFFIDRRIHGTSAFLSYTSTNSLVTPGNDALMSLIMPDGASEQFPFVISEVYQYDPNRFLIVGIAQKPTFKEYGTNNVWLIDRKGCVIWRIQTETLPESHGAFRILTLGISKIGQAYADVEKGPLMLIDIETGKVSGVQRQQVQMKNFVI